jgi:hypothetical protein
MPHFVLNGIQEPDFQSLDEFTQGYVQAIFFTETEPGTDKDSHDPETQSSLHGECGFYDLAPETLEDIKTDCAKFQADHAENLEQAFNSRDTYTAEQAGIDLWLTRNGHGAGFWDRGLGDIGQTLSDGCGWQTPYPEKWVHMGDDGKVYL